MELRHIYPLDVLYNQHLSNVKQSFLKKILRSVALGLMCRILFFSQPHRIGHDHKLLRRNKKKNLDFLVYDYFAKVS